MEEYSRPAPEASGEMCYIFMIFYSFSHRVEGVFLFGGKMINNKKKEWAIETLRLKSEELGRLPKKTDFDVVTMSRIKAFLGPWPRALETAKLKEAKKK